VPPAYPDTPLSTIHKKIDALISQVNRPATNTTFYPRIVNNTNVQISENETLLLQKGLEYSLYQKRKKNWLQKLSLEADAAASYLPDAEQDTPRHLISQQILKLHKRNNSDHKHNNPNALQELRRLHSIKEKLIQHKATVIKADKGNTMVIVYI
jgi:hypothetical protein